MEKMGRKQCECGQWFDEGEVFMGEVLGHRIELWTKSHCRSCALSYANKHSTICVVCGQPILPGTPVGGDVVGKHGTGLAHSEMGRYDCATAAAYCGTWGEGELIPIPDS